MFVSVAHLFFILWASAHCTVQQTDSDSGVRKITILSLNLQTVSRFDKNRLEPKAKQSKNDYYQFIWFTGVT